MGHFDVEIILHPRNFLFLEVAHHKVRPNPERNQLYCHGSANHESVYPLPVFLLIIYDDLHAFQSKDVQVFASAQCMDEVLTRLCPMKQEWNVKVL